MVKNNMPALVFIFLLFSLFARPQMSSDARLRKEPAYIEPLTDTPVIKVNPAVIDTYIQQKETIERNTMRAKTSNQAIIQQQVVVEKQADTITKKVNSLAKTKKASTIRVDTIYVRKEGLIRSMFSKIFKNN